MIRNGHTRLSVDQLASAAEVSVVTVRAHWQAIAEALDLRPRSLEIQSPGQRVYRRAVLIAAAQTAPLRTDQADDHDPITRLIYADPPDPTGLSAGLSANPGPVVTPPADPGAARVSPMHAAARPSDVPPTPATPLPPGTAGLPPDAVPARPRHHLRPPLAHGAALRYRPLWPRRMGSPPAPPPPSLRDLARDAPD